MQADGTLKLEYRYDVFYISHFMNHLFYHGNVKSDCLIIALIYMERFIETRTCPLTPRNVRPLIICSFLAASKVWDDKGLWTVDCADMFRDVGTLKHINTWERLFFAAVDWNLVVSAALYAKYYFYLRQFMPVASQPRLQAMSRERYLELMYSTKTPPRKQKRTVPKLTRSMTDKENLTGPSDLAVLS